LGLFSFFSRENKNRDNGALIIGFLRTATSKHLGHALGSKEYESACTSAAERIETVLLPAIAADKATQQEIVGFLSENCGDRFNEAFGAYLIVLWVRFGKIQIAIAQGKVKPEEATISILSQALHRQIKQLVNTQK
jgi:hypothetical protein